MVYEIAVLDEENIYILIIVFDLMALAQRLVFIYKTYLLSSPPPPPPPAHPHPPVPTPPPNMQKLSLLIQRTWMCAPTEKAGCCGGVPLQCEGSAGAACADAGPAEQCPPPAGGTPGHGEQDRRRLPAHRDHVRQAQVRGAALVFFVSSSRSPLHIFLFDNNNEIFMRCESLA